MQRERWGRGEIERERWGWRRGGREGGRESDQVTDNEESAAERSDSFFLTSLLEYNCFTMGC